MASTGRGSTRTRASWSAPNGSWGISTDTVGSTRPSGSTPPTRSKSAAIPSARARPYSSRTCSAATTPPSGASPTRPPGVSSPADSRPGAPSSSPPSSSTPTWCRASRSRPWRSCATIRSSSSHARGSASGGSSPPSPWGAATPTATSTTRRRGPSSIRRGARRTRSSGGSSSGSGRCRRVSPRSGGRPTATWRCSPPGGSCTWSRRSGRGPRGGRAGGARRTRPTAPCGREWTTLRRSLSRRPSGLTTFRTASVSKWRRSPGASASMSSCNSCCRPGGGTVAVRLVRACGPPPPSPTEFILAGGSFHGAGALPMYTTGSF
mmetsp:Transcript_12199/g.24312  ORF Transcript_12199/g.24312 Transcript_12199/m.24312 type:complete len:321 (-) Transcript_12199:250-1212(-)